MFDREKVAQAVRLFLEGIGENVSREGLEGTPDRVANMWEEFDKKHSQPTSAILSAQFNVNSYEDVVTVRDIPFISFCEHHLMPFFGTVCISYKPEQNKVLGISKLARLVEKFASKPQIQERLNQEICDSIYALNNVSWVKVEIRAEHMCMNFRGAKALHAETITCCTAGDFSETF